MPLSILLSLAPVLCPAPVAGQAAGAAVSADQWMRKAIDEQQHGNARAAIDDYRKALAINPNLPEARANLGAALAGVGDLDAAIEEDNRALVNAPDKTAVRMNLALAYYKKADWEKARMEFGKVHAARPENVSAAMLLGYSDVKTGHAADALIVLRPLEKGQETNADYEYVIAYALIEAGQENDGIPRMERVAAATHQVDAYVIAGSARIHRREFKEARADLDEAVKVDPNFPGAQTLAGQARDALGDTDAALAAFEIALRQDPHDLMANLYLGTMRLKQRDLEGARPLLQYALQTAPKLPQARLQWAKLNSMTGNFSDAAAALEELEKADPNWLDPHVELAALYYKLHRPEDGKRERDIVQQLEARDQNQRPSR